MLSVVGIQIGSVVRTSVITSLRIEKIRKYLNERLAKASISRIIIERTLKLVTITICTARPGIVIGKGGQDVDKLKEELKKLYKKDIRINIFEVKKPELDATIVGKNIATQIEHMIAYRRAIKMAVANTMRAGAEGIKVQITGRLNGAEMARKEMYKEGRTPLHTFRADIDYCQCEALTKVGLLGIKVWICRGEVYGKADLTQTSHRTIRATTVVTVALTTVVVIVKETITVKF